MQWWRQASVENHLKVTVEEILVEAILRRQKEYRRLGKSKGGLEGESMDSEG